MAKPPGNGIDSTAHFATTGDESPTPAMDRRRLSVEQEETEVAKLSLETVQLFSRREHRKIDGVNSCDQIAERVTHVGSVHRATMQKLESISIRRFRRFTQISR
jgi:hypothetical protein